MNTLAYKLEAALQKLCKWRTVFAGWQLGTRSTEDPESQAVRDHREVTILMRAEINAVTQLLTKKGACTIEEFHAQLLEEVQELDKAYERKFPGFSTTDIGVKMDVEVTRKTMKNWRL